MLSDSQALRLMNKEIFSQFPQDTTLGMSTPGYAKAINSPSLKYKIFNINNDEILVLYKDIKLFKNQFIRLLGFPISKGKNRNLEKALFRELCKIEEVREVELMEYDAIIHNISTNNLSYDNVEFLVNIQDTCLNNKYKSRYQINKYEKDINYRDATENDFEPIINLLNQWLEHKNATEEVHSKSIYKNIIKNPNKYLLEDFNTKVLYYKDELFAFSVYYEVENKIYQITNIINTFTDLFPHNLVKGGNRIVFYYTIKEYKDKDKISYMGSINPKSNVFKNKQLVYKTYDKVFKLKLKK